MKKKTFILAILFGLISCSTSKFNSKRTMSSSSNYAFQLTEISTDSTYGYSAKNPIEVGSEGSGPKNERRYLNALTGPNGETVSYYRAGSCCPIKSDNAIFGDMVMLDNYRVSWEGSTDTVSIYINMYDLGELKAPIGFGIKKTN